jgi:cell division protein FtsQ
MPAAMPVRRKRKSHKRAARYTVLTAAIIGALAFAVLSRGGSTARETRPFIEEADKLAEQVGMGLAQVSLSGHSMTSDRDIFDALDLTNARSMLRFDSLAARKRIEQLPWVKTAIINRVFPDNLYVEITERAPFAVWNRADRNVLIDETGRVLGAAPQRVWTELPRVAGEGAAEEAASVLQLVQGYPELAARLQEAIRVAERRWTLRLTDGTEIQLPTEDHANALARLMTDPIRSRLLDGSQANIDLRSADRLIVRPAPAGAAKETASHKAQPSG